MEGERERGKKDRGQHNVRFLVRATLLVLPRTDTAVRAHERGYIRYGRLRNPISYIGAGTFEKLSGARGVTALKPRGDIPFITVQSDRDIISAIYSAVAADWSEPTHRNRLICISARLIVNGPPRCNALRHNAPPPHPRSLPPLPAATSSAAPFSRQHPRAPFQIDVKSGGSLSADHRAIAISFVTPLLRVDNARNPLVIVARVQPTSA